jgi:D-methionine transport system permease protein
MLEAQPSFVPELACALAQTLAMLGFGLLAAVVFGGPLGIAMFLVGDGRTLRLGWLPRTLRWTVGALRSFPFVVLLIAVAPVTKLVAGSSVGPLAAAVPLSIAAIPCFARLVERTLRAVPHGTIEAARAFGASELQVVTHVLLVEARSRLVLALTALAVTCLAWAAAAGLAGGGGIGALAVKYGVVRFDTDIMLFTVAVLAALVQMIQLGGATLAQRLDRGESPR